MTLTVIKLLITQKADRLLLTFKYFDLLLDKTLRWFNFISFLIINKLYSCIKGKKRSSYFQSLYFMVLLGFQRRNGSKTQRKRKRSTKERCLYLKLLLYCSSLLALIFVDETKHIKLFSLGVWEVSTVHKLFRHHFAFYF